MRRILWLGLLFFISLQEGCFFGTFQTAHTMGPGQVDAGWYLTYPLYFNRQTRQHSLRQGIGSFDSRPNVGGFIEYGASEYLDFGLWGSLGEGIGPFGKFQFLGLGSPVAAPLDASVWFGFGYHPVVEGITGRVVLVAGKHLSPYSSVSFGWIGVNMPDYRKLDLPYDGNFWDHLRNLGPFRFFQALFVGIDISRREDVPPAYQKLPFGMTMEFTLPLVPDPALFFGIQFRR